MGYNRNHLNTGIVPTDPKGNFSKRAATWHRLLQHMQEDKPYLNSNLVQEDISRALFISNRTLSRILRQEAGVNFNTFVNRYRVAEARRMMRDEEMNHLSLEALAHRAGFNSRAVFYRCFQFTENESPARYRARQE